MHQSKNNLSTLWGGTAHQVSSNPYDGGTILFKGNTHEETDPATGETGIGVNFGPNNIVEVQDNEPAVISPDGSLNVFGAMKIPQSNDTFESHGRKLAKWDNKFTKKRDNSDKLMLESDPTNKYQLLTYNSGKVQKMSANNELAKVALERDNMTRVQENMLNLANKFNMSPKKFSKQVNKFSPDVFNYPSENNELITAGQFKDGGKTSIDSTGMEGMMKGKIAIADAMGNPSAHRMVQNYPLTYTFNGTENGNRVPQGAIGTHYMTSMGEYAVPMIQQGSNGELQYNKKANWKDKESIKFNTSQDAQYFAEHYKEVAPMMRNYKNGGKLSEATMKANILADQLDPLGISPIDVIPSRNPRLVQQNPLQIQETSVQDNTTVITPINFNPLENKEMDLKNIDQELANVESSGGDYTATNSKSSATGKYQFLWNSYKNKIKNITGVSKKEEFLRNPKAQENFFSWYVENEMKPAINRLRQYNTKNLTDKELGKLFHFKGEKGATEYLTEGKDRTRKNNMSIESYLKGNYGLKAEDGRKTLPYSNDEEEMTPIIRNGKVIGYEPTNIAPLPVIGQPIPPNAEYANSMVNQNVSVPNFTPVLPENQSAVQNNPLSTSPTNSSNKKKTSMADNARLKMTDVLPEVLTFLQKPDPVDHFRAQGQYFSPYRVSLQDQLNANKDTFNSFNKLGNTNPAAYAQLAAQKYSADSNVLANQFRINQEIASDTTNKNIALHNSILDKNLSLRMDQSQKKAAALANTRNARNAALTSIGNKIQQSKQAKMNYKAIEANRPFAMNSQGDMVMTNNQPYLFNRPIVAGRDPIAAANYKASKSTIPISNTVPVDEYGNPIIQDVSEYGTRAFWGHKMSNKKKKC